MATGIDLNRGSSNVALPVDVSSEIWANTVESSAVMSLARQIRLPGTGTTVQTITGDATADWVDETANKPVSRATLGKKSITPYKLAVIEPFSNEFKRDLPSLYAELARRLPAALAKKFDYTVFHGTAPGSGFDDLSATKARGLTPGSTGSPSTYKGLVEVDRLISAAGGEINGWVLAPQARQYFIGAVDSTGRPIFMDSAASGGRGMTILGAPTFMSKAAYNSGKVVGVAGDWSEALFGTVEGVQISISTEATLQDGTQSVKTYSPAGVKSTGVVTQPKYINLYQQNMFALRAEIEVGFVVRSADYFVRLTTNAALNSSSS